MNNGSVQQAICKDVIGVTTFSNSDLGLYIKILKRNIMCKGGSLASHFYLIREIKKMFNGFWRCKWLFKIVEESTIDEE